jgi:hypothetical protein
MILMAFVFSTDEHKVVKHAFRRQCDVHDLVEIHFEDWQEQFYAFSSLSYQLNFI